MEVKRRKINKEYGSEIHFFSRTTLTPRARSYLPYIPPRARELHHPDDRILIPGQIFYTVRVKSLEEISRFNAYWVAAISLLILIAFQIIDWLIRKFWKF